MSAGSASAHWLSPTEGCNGSKTLLRPLARPGRDPGYPQLDVGGDNPGWLFAQQEKGFADQLHDGVRGLLIDAHYGIETAGRNDQDRPQRADQQRASRPTRTRSAPTPSTRRCASATGSSSSPEVGEQGVYFCHGFCEVGALPIDRVFGDIRDFLAANPDEVLAIVVEDYVDPADIAAAAQRTGLLDYIYKGPISEPLPTLRPDDRLRRPGPDAGRKRGGGAAIPVVSPRLRRAAAGDARTPSSQPAQLTDPDRLPASCQPNRGPADAPLFLINHWIDTSPAPKPSNAAKVNTREAILDRVHYCQDQRDLLAEPDRGRLLPRGRRVRRGRGTQRRALRAAPLAGYSAGPSASACSVARGLAVRLRAARGRSSTAPLRRGRRPCRGPGTGPGFGPDLAAGEREAQDRPLDRPPLLAERARVVREARSACRRRAPSARSRRIGSRACPGTGGARPGSRGCPRRRETAGCPRCWRRRAAGARTSRPCSRPRPPPRTNV